MCACMQSDGSRKTSAKRAMASASAAAASSGGAGGRPRDLKRAPAPIKSVMTAGGSGERQDLKKQQPKKKAATGRRLEGGWRGLALPPRT